jgi:hypothetical protein
MTNTTYTFDENLLSDLFKEIYGFRPRGIFWDRWESADNDGKQNIWDDLCGEHEQEMENTRNAELIAIGDFESRVDSLLAYGAPDRLTAIRWIVDGLNLSQNDFWYGTSYICHLLGLPSHLGDLFTEALHDIMNKMPEEVE